MDKSAVLSFSTDGDLLQEREIALRNCGFEVVSVQTEIQARFEIEMGRCGVLVICFRIHLEKARDLTELFKKNCPDGCIIFVTNQTPEKAPQEVDYVVPDSGGPGGNRSRFIRYGPFPFVQSNVGSSARFGVEGRSGYVSQARVE
jgi:hypothetical protein